MAKKLSKKAKKRLKAAVESVENRSAAEIVVSLRPLSGSYAAPGLALGLFAPLIGLVYMLYSDTVFELWAILANTVVLEVVGALLGLTVLKIWPGVLGAGRLEDRVEEAAMAQFYRLGVSRTRDRSGILVYISSHERVCRVLPDVGVEAALERDTWLKAIAPIQRAGSLPPKSPRRNEELAKAIQALGPLLEKALPRREDDINELADIAEEETS